eukprot:TRINITY_DN30431_c0_g1_i1.p1 TRINITY_DN30431_c0_g1~~TRINITY_DN30431_c0_g1_i1.p1  ORF type:complete len:329 (+),score=135.67 TRINITY_DN30431_c0_g1_i1:75-989(+)
MAELRFDGKVAIVTGAGNGLGKSYALELAKRGCAVVVNDLGGSLKGAGTSAKVADAVVDEIKAAGGKAVANYDSVENGAAIVETAVKAFGKVDIVVNNAGILRDVSFKRMTDGDWDLVNKVHVRGAYSVTKAAWKYMQDNKYGRVVNVSSPAGLYGNVGQANYSTAKMGLVGFTQTLAKEGGRSKIHANIIAPLAGTRMLATVMPEKVINQLKPEYVTSLVVYLCHESCTENGSIFETGAGVYQRVQLARSKGYHHDIGKGSPSVEDIASNWKTINDMKGHDVVSYKSANTAQMRNLSKAAAKL